MMKNAFYFTSKAHVAKKLGHVAKQPDQKNKINFKSYEATAWLINNCNTHITQYLKK